MLTPLRPPPVTTRKRGVPRLGFGCRGGRWGGRCADRFRPRRTFAAAVPNKSVRTTPMAAMTNSHSTAKKATLIRVRVRAFIPCDVLGFCDAFGLLPLG